jgi:hypothetical protein
VHTKCSLNHTLSVPLLQIINIILCGPLRSALHVTWSPSHSLIVVYLQATPHISGPDSDYERLSDGRVPGATFTDPYTPMNPSFGNPTSNMGYNYSSFQVAVSYCSKTSLHPFFAEGSSFQGVWGTAAAFISRKQECRSPWSTFWDCSTYL